MIKEEFITFIDPFIRRGHIEKKLYTKANQLGLEGAKILEVIRKEDSLYFKVEQKI